MKAKVLVWAIAATIIGFTSCKKDADTNKQSGLESSKTTDIKLGEPVVFKLAATDPSGIVNWNVTPNTGVQMQPSGNSASFLFGIPGIYSVNATSGAIKGTTEVTVQDSIYNPNPFGGTNEPLTGDQIFITVSETDSMGYSGLIFRHVTEKKYNCLNHTLIFDNLFAGQNLKLDFKSVFIPFQEFCTAGEDYASSGTTWFPIEDGNHVFEAVLDGITYSGSFVKSGSTYTFNWPYNSGVTLSPTIIN